MGMGIISRLGNAAKAFSRSDYSEYSDFASMADLITKAGFNGSNFSGRRNAGQLVEAFETHCWLQAVVSRIATDEARTKWVLLEDDPETGKPKEVKDHDLYDFMQNPWKSAVGGTWGELVWLISAARSLDGNSYMRIRWGEGQENAPTEIWPIPHQCVSSVPTKQQPWFGLADHYDQTLDRLPPGEVLWIRRPSLSTPFGKGHGTAQALDDEISQDIWASKYNNAWFRNGGRPDIIVQVAEASKLERRRMEEEWNSKYKGFWNAFKTAFLNSETKIHQLNASHKDMEFEKGRKLLRDIIFQVFGIPPEIMGVVENSNRATAEAALYIYSLQCIFPRVQDLCANLNRLLVPLFIGEGRRARPVYLGFENPVRETEEFKLNKAMESWKHGLITRDQALDILGFDPVGGIRGEEYLQPENMKAVGPNDPRPEQEPEKKRSVSSTVKIFAPRGGVLREFTLERAA